MKKKWEYYNIDNKKVKEIQDKFKISELLATILVNRGITNEKDIEMFLNPTRKNFHDPFLMPDMQIATERIIKAISAKEKVIIYGDYDVDGITSTTVLKKFLEEQGMLVDKYIPNRLDEGYGLNKEAVEQIARDSYSLMITVDCGISGIEEVDLAKSMGLDVIITDHHELSEELPNALAIVDAKRRDSKYPFNQLAGVGVVFKLIQALSIKMNLNENEVLKYLDLVSIGTISDIVPLIDENRVIAKLGLKLIEITKNVGLQALIRESGYKKIDSNTISFGIAPRINACGRMGYEPEAMEIFQINNIARATELAIKLTSYNNKRQETEKKIFIEAIEKIEKENLQNLNAIVIGGDSWHHGVIGIVASKLTEMYFKPTILICFEPDGIGKGSGRSVPGFDLHKALCDCDRYLERYGGHEMAVGVTMKKENFNDFKEAFYKIADSTIKKDIAPVIMIDYQVDRKKMNFSIIEELKRLEPFGEGNRIPQLIYKNLKINSIRTLSEGKHLRLSLKDDNMVINAIGFNIGDIAENYLIGDKIDIVGVLEVNSYNGEDTIQINIKDIRKSWIA